MPPELHYHLFLVIFIWIFSNFFFFSMLSTLTLFFSENSKIRIFLRLLFIPEFSPPYYVLCTTLAPLLQNELSVIFVYYSVHKNTRFDSAFMYSQNLHHHPSTFTHSSFRTAAAWCIEHPWKLAVNAMKNSAEFLFIPFCVIHRHTFSMVLFFFIIII